MKKLFLSLSLGLVSVVTLASCQNNALKGHNVEKVEAKDATYLEKGTVEYYKCTDDDCGKIFSKKGKEITIDNIYTDYLALDGKVTSVLDNGNVVTDIKVSDIKGIYNYEVYLKVTFGKKDIEMPLVHWEEELSDGADGVLADDEYVTFETKGASFASKYGVKANAKLKLRLYSLDSYESLIKFFNVDGKDKEAVTLSGRDISVSYNSEEDYTSLGQAVIDAAEAEEVEYSELKKLYDAFVDKYKYLIDEYRISGIIADSSNKDTDYDVQNAILAAINKLEEKDQEIDLAVYKTKYKHDFFLEAGYETDEEIDEYIATIDVTLTQQANALQEKMEKLKDDIASSTIPVSEGLFEYYAVSQEYAALLGYNDYLEYAYEEVYGREYTVAESNNLNQFIKSYIVPFNKSYRANLDAIYDKASGRGAAAGKVATQYNKAITMYYNYYQPQFDYINAYSKLMGETYYNNYKNYYVSGNYWYSANENDYVTAYVSSFSDGTPFMFMGPSNQGTSTFIHEFGHYNAACEGGDNISYDLDEVQSQANEALFALYLNNNSNETDVTCQVYTDILMLTLCGAITDGFLVNELEKWTYTCDYTKYEDRQYLNYEEYNEVNGITLTEEEYNSLSEETKTASKYTYWYHDLKMAYYDICTKSGLSSEKSSFAFKAKKVLPHYNGYYISYATSAVGALEFYAKAYNEYKTNGNMTNTISMYQNIFKEHDEDKETFTSVLEFVGLYSVFDEECYKLIYSAICEE